MQSKVAYTKPVDRLSWENLNLGLTSAHWRLKHQDKTFYTSFASTLISHCTLKSGVDSDNLDKHDAFCSIMLTSSFKVSSICYCRIYKLTSKQILPVIILFSAFPILINQRWSYDHIASHFSISLVCLSMFRPKKSLKLICFTNGTIIPPNDGY